MKTITTETVGEKKKEEKKSRTYYRTNQNLKKIITYFLGFQLSASFPKL